MQRYYKFVSRIPNMKPTVCTIRHYTQYYIPICTLRRRLCAAQWDPLHNWMIIIILLLLLWERIPTSVYGANYSVYPFELR